MIIKKGTVVKISGEKTIKVEVAEYRQDPKYKKQRRVTRSFLAHDEKSTSKVGDTVEIQQSIPFSKKKTWALVGEKKLAKKS